ncbi:metallophosphoesterase family protein [Streptomonospora nanhaiensis]|uniref:3',5'-cyclic AMP phosphodiesterase CpdA n=1 Tax=Streptomonospora nanhaiensis TaxID=1323731 RepID=A0A853BP76_9ACTN|nr:metallophosphoesterase [Streptomonospora nanhaiensis]MBV2365178.1 metallophosphoesterase [Streptomonospora nanhaiensis]NYI97449.1 3',5'-cyclic AMP phosphodiesterase CpdA [Streptomonospora nanhaiensis]
MPGSSEAPPRLLAISDLHVSHGENRDVLDGLRPGSPGDWLIVAGDVAEIPADVESALGLLRERFAEVVWVPGNHELWTTPRDPAQTRGVERYEHLVELCRGLGVHTPEDPFPVWRGAGGPVTVAPLFTLYDYTFHPPGTATKEEGLAYARGTGVVCTDEYLLHPDPYPAREDWCRARLEYSERRLAEVSGPTVLVNHWPLVREPTDVLWYPEFAQWCGSVHTANWHTKYNAAAVVYGHLHIPRTTHYDGVRFQEVSLGYPREWRRRPIPEDRLQVVLPAPAGA